MHYVVNGFVQGVALLMRNEIEAQRTSGMTNRQWWDRAEPGFAEVLASGEFPVLSRAEDADFNDGYESMDEDFEFGLKRVLDGLEVFVGGRA
ncbi:TetR/AcrR family transcriptional regulator C-terminal domain-containing protein [Allokutzneria albata]|uniref:TetR/AcrR family transcriptional regulator C-terminal domain-containing protein n=1 Tax=Allokutzneria albata TaxID=211114 RepID=UPI0009F390C9|nr:TetR/AcrR family transcriptional regulator C-terminal domain-containing protein [Allokutzneria albata]